MFNLKELILSCLTKNNIIKVPIVLMLSILIFNTYSNDFDNAKQAYQAADNALNDAYRLVISKYSEDKMFIEKFRSAQRAWLKYRDAHMESRFPVGENEVASQRWGSSYQVCAWYEIAELTKARTKLIKRWLSPVEEGDVCRGSFK